MDVSHRLLKWIDHNRWTALALVLAVIAVGVLVGCAERTVSLIDHRTKVTADEFAVEVRQVDRDLAATYAKITQDIAIYEADRQQATESIEAGFGDLERQRLRKAQLADMLGAAVLDAATGDVNPVKLIVPALGIVGILAGIGKTVDNRKKDGEIKRRSETIDELEAKLAEAGRAPPAPPVT